MISEESTRIRTIWRLRYQRIISNPSGKLCLAGDALPARWDGHLRSNEVSNTHKLAVSLRSTTTKGYKNTFEHRLVCTQRTVRPVVQITDWPLLFMLANCAHPFVWSFARSEENFMHMSACNPWLHQKSITKVGNERVACSCNLRAECRICAVAEASISGGTSKSFSQLGCRRALVPFDTCNMQFRHAETVVVLAQLCPEAKVAKSLLHFVWQSVEARVLSSVAFQSMAFSTASTSPTDSVSSTNLEQTGYIANTDSIFMNGANKWGAHERRWLNIDTIQRNTKISVVRRTSTLNG